MFITAMAVADDLLPVCCCGCWMFPFSEQSLINGSNIKTVWIAHIYCLGVKF